jgi:hypothetical protein
MANKPFETYFGERTVLTGAQPVAGDELLILRSGTVFRGTNTFIKGSAILSDDATAITITVQDQWESIAGTLVVDVITPSLTFATNQFTFVSPNQINPTVISANVSLDKEVASGTQVYEIGIFVNDALIGNGIKAAVGESLTQGLSVSALHALQTGDVIELKIRNRDGIDNMTVANAQLIVG